MWSNDQTLSSWQLCVKIVYCILVFKSVTSVVKMSFLLSILRISEIISFPVISKFTKMCLSVWLLQTLKNRSLSYCRTILQYLVGGSLEQLSTAMGWDSSSCFAELSAASWNPPSFCHRADSELSVSPLFWVRAITAPQQHTRVQGGRKQMHTEKLWNVFTQRTQTGNYVHHCLTSDVVALQISVPSVATMKCHNVDWTQAHLFFSRDWTVAG